MDQITIFFIVILSILCINYLFNVWTSRLAVQEWEGGGQDGGRGGGRDGGQGGVEGFESMAKATEQKWIESPDLFDDFYAKVYDQLAQGSARLQAEAGLALHAFQRGGTELKDMRILDAGCGTAIVTSALAKMNVGKIIAVDQSSAMIKRAKTTTLDQSTLTEGQKEAIDFRITDLLNPSALSPGEVTNAICFYFVIYYIRDHEAFFRNMYVWTAPGGMMAIEVVNKYKFDPMLDSSAPWMGFSLQKYSKERVTKSKVTFDKFEYEGKFDLMDPVAEFRETFRFKDGTVRRQKHLFVMPAIEEIVKAAKNVGWIYDSHVDLTAIGFEYAYLLLFKHP